VGFAYVPDGVHGTTWGGDKEPEVESGDALRYLIDGATTTYEEVGDTGLDCYEPEFSTPKTSGKERNIARCSPSRGM